MTTTPVLHWFDFICPFCYIGQDRTTVIRELGREVIELPFQIHPEIGPGGAPAPERRGPMYDRLAQEAREAGLELNWSPRIPYSGYALAAAEAVRINKPTAHTDFIREVFDAYFARAEDIEDAAVIARCGDAANLDPNLFQYALTSGIAANELAHGLDQARQHQVTATPTWLIDGHLVVGLQPRALFRELIQRSASAATATSGE